MPILTLTTDYGLRDPYAGQLKGSLLSACPSATLVDISHHISPYDLVEAAYFLSHAYPHYPQGSIHICTVNNQGEEETPFLCFRRGAQTFLLPNNGLAFLLFQQIEEKIFRIAAADDGSCKACLAGAVAKLTLGFDPHHLGEVETDLVRSIRPTPVTSPGFIRGTIVHIDRYDNAVLNVHREDIERMRRGRIIHTRFSNSDPIVGIHEHYHEAPVGELLARYNSGGWVELAVNMGRAATLFGLSRDQLVQLEFA